MKKSLFAFMIMLIATASLAQATKGKTTSTKPVQATPTKEVQPNQNQGMSIPAVFAEHFGRKYSIATRWGDYDVAKDALYDLITEFPGNDSLIFALSYFYFENQKYANCVVVCNDLLARNSRNQAALELSGISYENLNIKDKALQNYETLFLITNSSSTLYKMASLQYDLKKYTEASTNSDILLSKPNLDSMKVVFNNAQEKSIEYPLRAALLNLKGLTYKAQGDAVNAKKFFEEALKVDATFDPAKKNLATLK